MTSDIKQPRVRAVGSARGASQFAGVLLHGRGKTPEEKIDLAARFGNIEGIRWVVPEAETPGSWYPGRFFDPREQNEPYLTEAVERCHEAVLEAGEYGRLAPERLVIVGFSQGASLALEYALLASHARWIAHCFDRWIDGCAWIGLEWRLRHNH